MPPLFWLDVTALGISVVLATSLALMALVSGVERAVNRTFALFIAAEATWAITSLLLRMSLWLGKGRPLFLAELTTLAISLMAPLLLCFATRFVGRGTRRTDLGVILGVAIVAVLSIPLFQHQLVSDPHLESNGSTSIQVGTGGLLAFPVLVLYIVWSLVLFWRECRRIRAAYPAFSVFLLLLGLVLGGVLNIPIPFLSITNTLSIAILGYGLVNQQLLSPLRDLTDELERKVEARTRELESAYAEVETRVQERTAELRHEISVRRGAEDALRASEERFRSIFENAVMGLYRTTPDGQILMANPALVRMLGYSSFEELAQRNLEQDGHAAGYPRSVFKEHIQAEGLVEGLESVWTGLGGSEVFVRESARAVRDELGNVLHYEGTVEDITARKQSETALRQANLIVESSPAMLFRWRAAEGWPVELVSENVTQLGYTPQELLSGAVPYAAIVHPDDLERVAREVEEYSASGVERFQQEYRIITKDGQVRWIEDRTVVERDAEGRVTHFQGIVVDVTERKQADAERERLLADLVRRSTQLLTAARVSASASTILDPEELIDETVSLIRDRFDFYYVGLFLLDEAGEHAVLHAGTGQAGQTMLEEGHKLAVGGRSMVGQCVAQGQARIAVDVGEEPVRFDNPHLPDTRSEMALPLISRGECIGALSVQNVREAAFSADDIASLQVMADHLAIAITNSWYYDEIQRYASRLKDLVAERTAELSTVNKELEAFAYSVSHDLRAPLRSMDGFSQALLEDYEDKLDAIGQDYLRRVRSASQRMGGLIDDLLNLSRLTRGTLNREAVDLSALAQTAAAQLRETQPERRVDFVIAPGIVANGDARLLQVVLENLLGNAWKFTSPHQDARIEFGVTRHDGETAYFVRDDGVGFEMAYADNLFRAFQRLHGVAEFEGSGIGLATVQRVVHRHGGRVWAEGAVDLGATFYFTLGDQEV